MLENVFISTDLTALARHKFRNNETKTVKTALADELISQG